jgi:CubicO group peptidase (beta-lactamase class C family)
MTGIAAAGAAELDAALNRFVTQGGLPGAAAGVVHGDELSWAAGAGFADTSAQVTSDPGTLYRIASITKTFTGTAVMQLRDAARLDLDDPAVKYLAELRDAVSPFAAIEAVTIRRMLSHESGLATEPPGTDWSVPVYQGDPQLTLARPGDIVLMLPPNVQHKYSDLAYQLLGEIVTRVSGIPYPRYVRELILDPLGMSATGFEPLDGPLLSRRAAGYSRRPFSDELGPGASVSASVGRGRPVVMRTRPGPVDLLPAARQDDVSWIQHSGGLPGFTTSVCFDPRQQVGAIVLHNGTCFTAELARELAVTARRLGRVRTVSGSGASASAVPAAAGPLRADRPGRRGAEP